MDIGYAGSADFTGWMRLVEAVQDSFPGLVIADYKDILLKKIGAREAVAARADGTVVGALLFSREKGEIEFLAVHPDSRRLGAAKALLDFMAAQLPEGACVSVITYREGDAQGQAARAFYSRLGFAPGRLLTVFGYPCQELYRQI